MQEAGAYGGEIERLVVFQAEIIAEAVVRIRIGAFCGPRDWALGHVHGRSERGRDGRWPWEMAVAWTTQPNNLHFHGA